MKAAATVSAISECRCWKIQY